ncbi:hypothetical protein NG895_25405 [Aeoliella sp. ICT_H6.2]|uniref:DUF6690 domain-containing protein n=1 Tax=Aeoliella straminimaris TaxID=2954799 RepID=A0A9X2FJJ1_9BACT|nr:DUF6690 family protein [Aeoliella straminimaris]MCO6047251.1 hypothetical protein [Aeoliella straminimaris]
MPRPVMLAGLLGAAVGVPYVVDHSAEWRDSMMQPASQAQQPADPNSPQVPQFKIPEPMRPPSPGDHIYSSPAPLEGIATYSLADVLRLDVNKEWIYSRWARKSTGLAEPELFGIRVPLVSGTRMTDVAGSLTYYFDKQGIVQKIRLKGKTADTSELVNLLATRYGFRPATPLVAGEQLFRVDREGVVESELRTQPESVLWATSPHTSFSVDLELNRPGSGRYVQRPMPRIKSLDMPAEQPQPLFGEQQQAPGTAVFPGESVVPSTNGVKAEQASATSEAPAEATPPPKVHKPVLRWPS